MKRVLFILGVAVLTLSSFSGSVQDAGKSLCKAYFPLEKGTELTYENYSAKDKLQSTDYLSVTDIIETAEALTIKVHASSEDKKGKQTYESDFEYLCENGVFKMSMESMVSGEMMEAYKDMEVEITQTELAFPSDATVGQTLPDAEMNMKISSNGIEMMTMTFKITDRKIEAKESITTPAGTFEAFKFSQSTNMKMMFMDKTYKSVDWIVENIGSVRSETYSSSGKLENYRILTNIKR